MMMERPRTRIVEKKTTTTAAVIEHEKQDQLYYRLKKIRENDRHFGEHEMTRSDPPRGRKPARIAICLDRNYGEHEVEVHDWDTDSSETTDCR